MGSVRIVIIVYESANWRLGSWPYILIQDMEDMNKSHCIQKPQYSEPKSLVIILTTAMRNKSR